MNRIIITLLLALFALGVQAQSHIDRVIDDLEKNADVETTYAERRTKKKHRLYRITMMLKFNNDNYYKRLARAFESDRQNAVRTNKNGKEYTYRFEDKDGVSTYNLSPGGVVKSWRSCSDGDDGDDSTSMIIGTFDDDGGSMTLVSDNYAGMRRSAQSQAAEARKQAAEARKQAAKARSEARKLAAEARKQAAEARKQAAKARGEARKQAAKARSRSASTSVTVSDDGTVVCYTTNEI